MENANTSEYNSEFNVDDFIEVLFNLFGKEVPIKQLTKKQRIKKLKEEGITI